MSVHRLRGPAVDCPRPGCPVQVVSTVNRKDTEVSNETITERRGVDEIRADLAKRHERSGPFPASGVQMALGRLANDVEGLLAEVDAIKRDRARLIAQLHASHRDLAAARGVIQAVQQVCDEREAHDSWRRNFDGSWASRSVLEVPEVRAALAASLPVPTEPPTDREIIDSLIGKTPNAAVDQLVNRIAGVPTVPTEPTTRHVRHSPWGQDPSGYCGCSDCCAPDDVPTEPKEDHR